MASCKDCLHYEACESQVPRTFWNSETFYYHCKCFKDRTRFVELPCKVGDKVYLIKNHHINEHEVTRIIIDRRKIIIIQLMAIDYVCYAIHISRKDFGKTVFLTREEAERALKNENRIVE